MKKFELTTEQKINFLGRTLYRIKACISFTTASGDEVKAGDLGGFVEKEQNLSHDGKAWVYGNAEMNLEKKLLTGITQNKKKLHSAHSNLVRNTST